MVAEGTDPNKDTDSESDQVATPTPEPKTQNDLNVKPYSQLVRLRRRLNSIEYDKAAFEVDGGESQFLAGRAPFFTDPKGVDQSLWSRAKDASMQAYGSVKWQFVLWWYLKQGGKLNVQ